jgi:hypothetical protein
LRSFADAAFNLMQARLKRYVEDRTAMIGAISHDLRPPSPGCASGWKPFPTS